MPPHDNGAETGCGCRLFFPPEADYRCEYNVPGGLCSFSPPGRTHSSAMCVPEKIRMRRGRSRCPPEKARAAELLAFHENLFRVFHLAEIPVFMCFFLLIARSAPTLLSTTSGDGGPLPRSGIPPALSCVSAAADRLRQILRMGNAREVQSEGNLRSPPRGISRSAPRLCQRHEDSGQRPHDVCRDAGTAL